MPFACSSLMILHLPPPAVNLSLRPPPDAPKAELGAGGTRVRPHSPRCRRIRSITSASVMNEIFFMRPPHLRHLSASTPYTRAKSCPHVRRRARACAPDRPAPVGSQGLRQADVVTQGPVARVPRGPHRQARGRRANSRRSRVRFPRLWKMKRPVRPEAWGYRRPLQCPGAEQGTDQPHRGRGRQ